MPKYFRYFPEVKHNGFIGKNITRRVRFNDTIANDPYIFLPYTIKEGEKAEDIANIYYGDVNKVWLVWMSANVIDPYFDWPMIQSDLDAYIIDKYREEAEEYYGRTATDQEVLNFTQNATITENVHHYYDVEDEDIIISTDTYAINASDAPLDPDFTAANWVALRYYDYEFNINEDKRHITLVDKRYAEQMQKELKSIMNV